jgi:lysophospholipase L1-like esterase
MTMQQILVYADSLSWGLIPGTRSRLPFHERWPGILEVDLTAHGHSIRVIEDCLNGRRTVWDDPFKPGRNGLQGIEQRIEVNSPLGLVIVMLGENEFQAVLRLNAFQSAQGLAAIVAAIRRSPIEPGMPIPSILLVAPPTPRAATGPMADKFAGAEETSVGLDKEIQRVAVEAGCHFFNAGAVIEVSPIDGVHLDADQHSLLGRALTGEVGSLLQAGPSAPMDLDL